MTYQEAYKKAVRNLNENQISDAESDAWILMEHVTGTAPDIMWTDSMKWILKMKSSILN